MLDDKLLSDFIHDFFGYGNYQAPYWFVGMEEGGGHTLDDISRRLKAWDARGRKELEDVAAYHRAIGISEHFTDQPKLQPTWNKLIRTILSAQDQPCDVEHVREYQKSKLGTLTGDACLLELMPLPSRNTSTWLYANNSLLPYLARRDEYRSYVAPLRIAHLRGRLAQHTPKAVVFYGLEYRPYWIQIAGASDWQALPGDADFGRRKDTVFVLAKHPAARGISNEYFHEIGAQIRRRIAVGS